MAEAQAAHRHHIEKVVIGGNASSQKTGLWLGFVLALIVIVSGAWLIYTGHLVWGAFFTGFPLLSLVSIFVLGKREQKQELQAHRSNQLVPQRDVPIPD